MIVPRTLWDKLRRSIDGEVRAEMRRLRYTPLTLRSTGKSRWAS
jgi:hypothetical protein